MMKGRSRVLWLVRAGIALDAMLYSGLIPLLPQMGSQGHLNDGTLGLLLGIFPLAGLLGCIPFGILSDRFSPQPLLVIGMLASALGTIAIALWPDPLVIGLGRFTQGLAGSAVWTAGFALVHQYAGPDRQSGEIGLSYSASSAGELSGPLLSGFLAERASAALFFWIGGLVSAAAGALMALTRTPRLERSAPPRVEPASRRGRLTRLAGGVALVVVINLVYGGLLILAPLLLARDYRLTAFAIGQVFLGWHIVMIVSQTGGGHWGDRVPRGVPILAGMLAMAAGLAVMSAAHTLIGSLGGMALAGAGCGVAVTAATALFSDAWESVQPAGTGMGFAFGVMMTVTTIGFTLGNTLGGALMISVSPPDILAGAAVVSLATCLAALFMGKYTTPGVITAQGDL